MEKPKSLLFQCVCDRWMDVNDRNDPIVECPACGEQTALDATWTKRSNVVERLIANDIAGIKKRMEDFELRLSGPLSGLRTPAPNPAEINALVYNHTQGMQNHMSVLERRIEQLEANNLALSKRMDQLASSPDAPRT